MSLEMWRQILDQTIDHRNASIRTLRKEEAELDQALELADAVATTLDLVQQLAEEIQTTAHNRISAIVSKCLASVFNEPYVFRIEFNTTGTRTTAQFVFERDGELVDPLTAAGGGVVDVAAFGLRLACLLLCRPPGRRLLVLDEPFKFVSREYLDNVRDMLEELTDKMDVQLIMVTHIPELQVGDVFSVN